MLKSKGLATTLAVLAITLLLTPAAAQGPYLYGNNASSPSPYVYQIDKTTGVVIDVYKNLSGINGRGVLVIGTTMYYTTNNSNDVNGYDISTHKDLGVMFSVSLGSLGLASIAYDGNGLWIQDYGSTAIFHYTLSGAYLGTINVNVCNQGACDGLTYFGDQNNSWLVSNRGDSIDPYDLYDFTGIPGPAGFITSTSYDTGIAWDCSNFFTSAIYSRKINVWNSSGGFVKTLTVSGWPTGYPPNIEGLSTGYPASPASTGGACPAALGVSCIFYTGDSSPGICGRQTTYLPNERDKLGDSTIFGNMTATKPFHVKGIFINSLIAPTDTALYTTAPWEIRSGISDGNGGTLIASGTCALSATPNGQNANKLIGVWFVCGGLNVDLSAGAYWFSLSPSAGNNAAHHAFQWSTTQDPPLIGTQQEQCWPGGGKGGPSPNCSFFSGFGLFTTTRDVGLPYPTAGITAGTFSWGLF